MSVEKGVTERSRPFSMPDPDDIVYSPIEQPPNYKHDWNIGAQVCNVCGLDLLDYLAYGFPCKRK